LLTFAVNQKKASDGSVPDDYCDVKFTTWLDLFCEYALELAKDGEMENAYATLRTASDANVWYHSKDAMFLIHITWSGSCSPAFDRNTDVLSVFSGRINL
jgi:general transcription factor 3C polypeptide 3 (transcription factor C subunit 4)